MNPLPPVVIVAPVLTITTTEPTVGVDAAAATTIDDDVNETMDATWVPASVTDEYDEPPPSMLDPLIVTRVPSCPEVGDTPEIIPCVTYENPLVNVAFAPVSAVTTTSPVAARPLLAFTVTEMVV